MNEETTCTEHITIELPRGVTVNARHWVGFGGIKDSLKITVTTTSPDAKASRALVAEAVDRILHHAETNP